MSQGTHTYHSHSEQDTTDLSHRFAEHLRGGEYISLEGDLGAGKTFFTRSLASALAIPGPVTSPTFVIQKIHSLPPNSRGISQLAHYDFYRIADYHELLDLGFEDHDSSTIVLAEWGNLFIDDFPRPPVRINIRIGTGDHRLIDITNFPLL